MPLRCVDFNKEGIPGALAVSQTGNIIAMLTEDGETAGTIEPT